MRTLRVRRIAEVDIFKAAKWYEKKVPLLGLDFAAEVRRTLSLIATDRSEEHTSELQSPCNLVCRLLLEKKKQIINTKGNQPHHTTVDSSLELLFVYCHEINPARLVADADGGQRLARERDATKHRSLTA